MTFRSADIKYLIQDHGKEVTYSHVGSVGSYVPGTGLTGGSTTDYTVVVYNYNYRLEEVDGDSILRGDRRAAMPVTDVNGDTIPEPEPGDTLAGEGDEVTVVSVSQIMSGPEAVCYILQVRE